MRKRLRMVFLILGVVFVGIQFVPVDRRNPPVTGEIVASSEVMHIFRTSCYDCHSNETHWPWYGRVAPISWRIAKDIREARENLNFSTWDWISEEDKDYIIHQIVKEVKHGKMPIRMYTRVHPDTKLTEDEIGTLEAWAKAQ